MIAPKLPSFFKSHRAKQFEFKPRFYDARKERIEELRKKYAKSDESNASRQDFRREWERHKPVRGNSSSSFRLLLIIVVLTLGAMYILGIDISAVFNLFK